MNLFILVFISIGAAIGSIIYIKNEWVGLFNGKLSRCFNNNDVSMIGGGSDGKAQVEFLKDKPKAQDPAAVNQAATQPAYTSGQAGENLNYNIHTNSVPDINDASDEDNTDDSNDSQEENTRKIKGYINQTGNFNQQINGAKIDLIQSNGEIVNMLSKESDSQGSIPVEGELLADSNGEEDQIAKLTIGEGVEGVEGLEGGNNVGAVSNIIRGGQGEKLSLGSLTPKSSNGKHYTGPALSMFDNLGIREAIYLYAVTKALSSGQNDLAGGGATVNSITKKEGFVRMVSSIATLEPKSNPEEIARILLLANILNKANAGEGGSIEPSNQVSADGAGPQPQTPLLPDGEVNNSTDLTEGKTEEETEEKSTEDTTTENEETTSTEGDGDNTSDEDSGKGNKKGRGRRKRQIDRAEKQKSGSRRRISATDERISEGIQPMAQVVVEQETKTTGTTSTAGEGTDKGMANPVAPRSYSKEQIEQAKESGARITVENESTSGNEEGQ